MTITINTNKLLAVLLGFLLVFYATNIVITGQLAAALIEKPVDLSFVLIPAPADQCEKCFDPQEIVTAIDAAHPISYETSVVTYDSSIGQKYIDMYDLEKLPAIIVTGDISNEKVTNAWEFYRGRIQEDQVIMNDFMPYYAVADGSMRGVVDLVLLTDDSCETCFDANAYFGIIQRFGMVPGEIVNYDANSEPGAALIVDYKITKLPTILLSPDASEYTGLTETWNEVGTIAEDGWFILREVQKLSADYINVTN